MKLLCVTCALVFSAGLPLRAQTAADSAAIRATALDYIDGWYTGNADRMTRALHPALVKRILVIDDAAGRRWVDEMGASALIAGTQAGHGKEIKASERREQVSILDIFGNAASVRIDAGPWIDYLHMIRWDGRWVILNVLWEERP